MKRSVNKQTTVSKQTTVEKDTIFCWTNDNKYKIVLVGDSGVGKTSIFWQYIEEFFPDDVSELKVTMVDFKIKNIVIDNELIKLYIWDTAGQERYRSLVSNYFKGTHGIILIFDIGNLNSFESIKNSWINLCKDKSSDALFILVGNKSDLKEKRQVSEEQIQFFAQNNQLPYFEVSAYDSTNINDAFDKMANDIKSKFFPKEIKPKENDLFGSYIEDATSQNQFSKKRDHRESISLKKNPTNNLKKKLEKKECQC